MSHLRAPSQLDEIRAPGDRTPAEWRARFELLAANRQFVDGFERAAARRWAYYELLVDWTEARPDVAVMPCAEAEALARAALAAVGIGALRCADCAVEFCTTAHPTLGLPARCARCEMAEREHLLRAARGARR